MKIKEGSRAAVDTNELRTMSCPTREDHSPSKTNFAPTPERALEVAGRSGAARNEDSV